MRPLVIVGAGGHGREVLDVVEAINARAPTFEVLGFAADDADPALLAARGQRLLGSPSEVLGDGATSYALGIGWPGPRRRLGEELRASGADAVEALVHPTASIGSACTHGVGLLLLPGAVMTTNVRVGRHVHLNVGAVLSHDCVVGDYVTLSPRATVNGNVHLGDEVFLGTGAVVVPGCRIGDGAVVGAGAVVTGDVPPGVTAVGVPARWA